MSSLFRSTLFVVLLTACGGLEPAVDRTAFLPASGEVPGGEDRSGDDDTSSAADDDPGGPPTTDAPDPATPPAPTPPAAPTPTPPAPAPGTCTTADGQVGLPDCDGVCRPAAFLGDGYCDDGSGGGADFACAAHGDDGGDCGATTPAPTTPAPTTPAPPAPTPPVCTTAAGAPGIYDCDGVCAPDAFIGDGYCDDGSGDANFQCPQHNDDGGDCGTTAPTPAPGSPTPPPVTPPPPAPPAPPAPTTCVLFDGTAGVIDCAGTCAPAHWVGDGYCDDGFWSDADFECPAFNDDGGDC